MLLLGLAVLSGEADEADEEDDSGCGWLAGSQTNNPSKRNLRSIAGLKVHQKNIQKTRWQAGGYKSKMCI